MAVKSDLIEHPCVICDKPSRSCGHTRKDLRAFRDRCRAIQREARLAQAKEPRRRKHVIPSEGPGVFRDSKDDNQRVTLVLGNGRRVRARFASPEHPVRTALTDDEYCGKKATS